MRRISIGAALVLVAATFVGVTPTVGATGSADACLELAPGVVVAEEWSALGHEVTEAIESRLTLFPTPSVADSGSRLDISSGHAGLAESEGMCLEVGYEWTSRFGRAFLDAAADQMLAEAPTTPGIDSNVTIEWSPAETRLRTTLVFAGPFDIPNGTCWIDDALSVDAESDVVVTSGEQGVKTSPFAEGACDRFFDHLPDGGAGEQVITLLPASVTLEDGGVLRFLAEQVSLYEDAIVVSGRVARD